MTRDVLVVEDDRRMSAALARALERAGCRVEVAASVREALARLTAEPPIDLIVLDVLLGDGTGIEVADAAWRLTPAPAIVALSGHASREQVFRLGQLGVRAFIDKHDVHARIGEILELAEAPTPLEPHVKNQVGRSPLPEIIRSVRDGMLAQALALAGGSPSKASRRLGVSRQAVQQIVERRKRKKHGDG